MTPAPAPSANAPPEPREIMLACDECGTPLAAIQLIGWQWRLVFRVRHHGEVHETLLTLHDIYDKILAVVKTN